MQETEQPQQGGDLKGNFNLLIGLCTIMAFPIEVCTTRFGTWGERYLNRLAMFGAFWPLVFVAFYGPRPQIGSVVLFWFLMVALLLVHRACGMWRRHRGYRCHSHYWGQCWLDRRDGLSGGRVRRQLMAIIILFVGLLCFKLLIKPLGALFMIGAIAKLFADSVAFQAVNARVRQMEDARIENEFFQTLWRQISRRR
jgi:hypothetical protein